MKKFSLAGAVLALVVLIAFCAQARVPVAVAARPRVTWTRTATATATLAATPTPNCIPPEYFNAPMNRCRLPQDDLPQRHVSLTPSLTPNPLTPVGAFVDDRIDPCIWYQINWTQPPPKATLDALPTPHPGCAIPSSGK